VANNLKLLYLPILLASITLAQPLPLTLKRAIELSTSTEGNAQVQIAAESIRQAESRAQQSRADLLPNLTGTITQQSATQNLAGLGLSSAFAIPGLNFPTFIGPYNLFDARVRATQSIIDLGSLKRYQATKSTINTAKSGLESTQEQIAAHVARTYLAALRADADIETAEANAALSQAIQKQAEQKRDAGTGTGIEITRAKVQLSADRQRLLAAKNDRRRATLELLRWLGLGLDTDVQLTDKLTYVPLENTKPDYKDRPDYTAQLQREATAKLSSDASKLSRLPTLGAFGNYGALGSAIDNSRATRAIGIELRVQVFDHAKRARTMESASQYIAEKARTRDLKQQIELEVRLALDNLSTAQEQLTVAREGLELSQSEVAQALRRYDAGVSTGLEVTDAQTRLERARDNLTAALYAHNMARIDLAQATGTIRKSIQ
jgi:outer membrane protein TolC